MVDEGRIARLLRGIAERTDRLTAAFESAVDDRGDLWLDGIKYLLVTTIEGCVDVAQHIVSSEGLGVPDSNAHALRLLSGPSHIIDAELADDLARAVGFRNVLVHQYAVVDDDLVLLAGDRLDDFRRFVQQVSAWLLAGDG